MTTTPRRLLGDGTVTRLRNGRYWVRAPKQANGDRPGLGTYATYEEADAVLNAARAQLGLARANAASFRFASFARTILNEREVDGFRGVEVERARFEFHLANSSIAEMSVAGGEIEPIHIANLARELMRKKAAGTRGGAPINRGTVQRVISFVSTVMRAAVERGLRPSNPCIGIQVKRRKHESKNRQTWTFLKLDEQRAIATCEKIPLPERLLFRFAWGSGLREGELAHNFLSDLRLDAPDPFLHVRFGGKGTPPKSGKERRVMLFGDALAAVREWVKIRPSYLRLPRGERDHGLIFPTVHGCARASGKPLGGGLRTEDGAWIDRVKHFYQLAGVELRPYLHWHALRHTCASSLLQGHWGRRWTLEEIRDHLGHSSIVVTQMYAHLADETMSSAARETPGPDWAR